MTDDENIRESETTGQQAWAKVCGITPDYADFSVSGKLTPTPDQQDPAIHELAGESEVVVTLTNMDGEVIYAERCEVVSAGVSTKRDSDGFVTRVRHHKIKVG